MAHVAHMLTQEPIYKPSSSLALSPSWFRPINLLIYGDNSIKLTTKDDANVEIFGGQKHWKYSINKTGKRKDKNFKKRPVRTQIGGPTSPLVVTLDYPAPH